MDQESIPVCSAPKVCAKHLQPVMLHSVSTSKGFFWEFWEVQDGLKDGKSLLTTRISPIKPGLGFPPPSCHQCTTQRCKNPSFSLKIIDYSNFSQEFGSLLWDPNPEVMPSSTLGCLEFGDLWSCSLFPEAFVSHKSKKASECVGVIKVKHWSLNREGKMPQTGIFFHLKFTPRSRIVVQSDKAVVKRSQFKLRHFFSSQNNNFKCCFCFPFSSSPLILLPWKTLGKKLEQLHRAFPKSCQRWQRLSWAPHEEMLLL